MEDNLLYSKSTDLNLNFIQKYTFPESSRIMFEQICRYCGLINLPKVSLFFIHTHTYICHATVNKSPNSDFFFLVYLFIEREQGED